MSQLYVKNHFNEDAKSQAETLVSYVRQEFDNVLNSIDWMDEVTRIAAKEKATAIRPQIAYPPELLMDDKLIEHYNGVS